MEVLSADQLFEALTNYYAQKREEYDEDLSSSFTTLKDQKINGKRAMKMSTLDFSNIGIAYGDAMDLKAMVEKINEEMSSKPVIETDVEAEKGDQSLEEQIDEYEDIKQYFSPEEFKEMGDYEKKTYKNIKENYELLVGAGIPKALPLFMRPKKRGTTDDTEPSKQPKQARPSCSSTQSKKPAPSSSRVNKTLKTVTEEEYAARLPSYDIDNILSNCKGKKVRELEMALKAEGALSSVHMKLMIRTLVLKEFCDQGGSYIKGTSSNQKEGLAASIVKAYPFFKDSTDKRKWTWWRVYDRKLNRGRIPNVIANLQRKDEDNEGPPGKNGSHDESEDDTVTSAGTSNTTVDEFAWLGHMVPTMGNHIKILEGMKDSVKVRRAWIKGKTIHDVLEKFPHLVSYEGELIEEEFKLLYPQLNHEALLQTFPIFISKLKSLETLPTLEHGITDDVIQGCLWLAQKMPWQNLKRFGKQSTREIIDLKKVVTIIPAGTDVKNIITERRSNADGPVQPYLIALIPEQEITKMFVVVDNKTILIQSSSFVKGLDVLFKVYHVFDVHYPAGWARFFDFVEWGFYKLNERKLTNMMKDLITRVETTGST